MRAVSSAGSTPRASSRAIIKGLMGRLVRLVPARRCGSSFIVKLRFVDFTDTEPQFCFMVLRLEFENTRERRFDNIDRLSEVFRLESPPLQLIGMYELPVYTA